MSSSRRSSHSSGYSTFGIVGGGFVGSATSLLASDMYDCIVYDLDESKRKPAGCTLKDLVNATVIFVCVPTPMNKDKSCYTGIVESVIHDIRRECPGVPIVVRSTVPVGFSERMGVAFMPEFLTEKNWRNDVANTDHWVFGAGPEDDAAYYAVKNILHAAEREGTICGSFMFRCYTNEAEMVKYFRNCYLATKVAFCNEMEKFCSAKNAEYNHMMNMVLQDQRIGHSHTSVPGPDGKHGFGGTCFPKDMNSLIAQMKSHNVACPVITAAVERNETIDRAEHDWMTGEYKNRAHV